MLASELRQRHAETIDNRLPRARVQLAPVVAMPSNHRLKLTLLVANQFGTTQPKGDTELLELGDNIHIHSHATRSVVLPPFSRAVSLGARLA